MEPSRLQAFWDGKGMPTAERHNDRWEWDGWTAKVSAPSAAWRPHPGVSIKADAWGHAGASGSWDPDDGSEQAFLEQVASALADLGAHPIPAHAETTTGFRNC